MGRSSVDHEAWRKQYRSTTQALERIHALETAALTDQRALEIILSLTTTETPFRERMDWSGLVEQQAFFHRRKSR